MAGCSGSAIGSGERIASYSAPVLAATYGTAASNSSMQTKLLILAYWVPGPRGSVWAGGMTPHDIHCVLAG